MKEAAAAGHRVIVFFKPCPTLAGRQKGPGQPLSRAERILTSRKILMVGL